MHPRARSGVALASKQLGWIQLGSRPILCNGGCRIESEISRITQIPAAGSYSALRMGVSPLSFLCAEVLESFSSAMDGRPKPASNLFHPGWRQNMCTTVLAGEGGSGSLIKQQQQGQEGVRLDTHTQWRAIEAVLQKRRAPERTSLLQLLQSCESSEDINLVQMALSHVRMENAVLRGQLNDFSEDIVHEFIAACFRAGRPVEALRVLSRGNIFGLRPSLGSTHLIMTKAGESGDIGTMLSALERFRRNSGLSPTKHTVEILFKYLVKQNDRSKRGVARFIGLVEDFHGRQGLPLLQETWDAALDLAASDGRSLKGSLLLEWRQKIGIPQNHLSAISTAKIFLLTDDVSAAMNVVASNPPNESEREKWTDAVKAMVTSWPVSVFKNHKSPLVSSEDLRTRMIKWQEELTAAKSISLPVNVAESFPA